MSAEYVDWRQVAGQISLPPNLSPEELATLLFIPFALGLEEDTDDVG